MKFIFAILLLTLYSCTEKETCTLEPIPENVFDISTIAAVVKFKSGTETERLTLNDTFEDYTKESLKSFGAKRDCSHTKSCSYLFKDEPIEIMLKKDQNGIFTLHTSGWFTIDAKQFITEAEIKNGKEFIFESDAEPLHNSVIKKIVVISCQITTITTTDGRVWVAK